MKTKRLLGAFILGIVLTLTLLKLLSVGPALAATFTGKAGKALLDSRRDERANPSFVPPLDQAFPYEKPQVEHLAARYLT